MDKCYYHTPVDFKVNGVNTVGEVGTHVDDAMTGGDSWAVLDKCTSVLDASGIKYTKNYWPSMFCGIEHTWGVLTDEDGNEYQYLDLSTNRLVKKLVESIDEQLKSAGLPPIKERSTPLPLNIDWTTIMNARPKKKKKFHDHTHKDQQSFDPESRGTGSTPLSR